MSTFSLLLWLSVSIQDLGGTPFDHKKFRSGRRASKIPPVELPVDLSPAPDTFPCKSPATCTSYRNCPEVLLKLSSSDESLVLQAQMTYCGEDGPDEPKVCCHDVVPNNLPEYSNDSLNIPVAFCGYSNLNLLDKRAKQFLSIDRKCLDKSYKGPEELSDERNRRRKRLTGGFPSRIGQWPWLVTLFYTRTGTKGKGGVARRCIGTIVTSRVLIAEGSCFIEMHGHIINEDRLHVTVGDFDTSDWPLHSPDSQVINGITFRSPEPQLHEIEAVTHIPNKNVSFPQKHYKQNFAIIRVKTDIQFNKYIQPICLRTSDFDKKFVGYPVVASYSDGEFSSPYERFGLPRHAVIPVFNLIHCARSKPYYPSLYDILKRVDPKTLICAGGVKEDFLCHMDDGAPLMRQAQDGRWFLGGIHMNLNLFSYLKNCPKEDSPHFFTNVMNWIEIIIKIADLSS